MAPKKSPHKGSDDHAASEEKRKVILSVPSRDKIGLKDQTTKPSKDETALPEQLLNLRVKYLAGQLSREDYQSAKKEMTKSAAAKRPSKNLYAMITVVLVVAVIIGVTFYM